MKAIYTKQLTLVALLICMLSIPAVSQVRVGILGGIHQSDVVEENNVPNFDAFKKGYSPRTGAHFGIVADMPFSPKSNFYFQPGVIFQNKGRKYADSITGGSGSVYVTAQQYVDYIDVPLNIVYKFGKKVKLIIGAGPYGSFFYNGKEKKETLDQGLLTTEENTDLPVGNEPGSYRVIDYGVNGLLGVEIGAVFLTANYSRGLHNFYESKDYEGSFKHQLFGATFGIYFAKLNPPDNKPKDFDNDGIPDLTDACPDSAGTAITNGCPDKDSDGIADREDKCADIPGTAALNGCPLLDTDKDGVADDADKCPAIAGVTKYNGCPVPDADKDGINDELDKCPGTAGSARYNGCPVPDSDNDGINDELDKCPNAKGIKEKEGCPEEKEVQKEIVDKVNYAAKKIQFEFAKASLVPASFTVLDGVVSVLKSNPGLRISIEGHTSTDGIYEANMKLSQSRADNVKAYLVSKGIDAGRISSQGFGPNQPLNKSRTGAEKAANRRVEMKLSN